MKLFKKTLHTTGSVSKIISHITEQIFEGIVEKGNVTYISKQICVYTNVNVIARTL